MASVPHEIHFGKISRGSGDVWLVGIGELVSRRLAINFVFVIGMPMCVDYLLHVSIGNLFSFLVVIFVGSNLWLVLFLKFSSLVAC